MDKQAWHTIGIMNTDGNIMNDDNRHSIISMGNEYVGKGFDTTGTTSRRAYWVDILAITLISIALTLVIIVTSSFSMHSANYNIATYAAIGNMCVLASVLLSDACIKSTIIR